MPSRRQVHGGSQRQQALVGADVGGGAFALDVLFAGGQGQHVGALAAVIDGLADQAAGHLVDVLLAGGEEAQVGPAKRQRDAQRLAFADHDIGAHLAGGLEQAQGGGVGDHADQGALGVGGFDQVRCRS